MADEREGADEVGQLGTEEAQKYAKLVDEDLARDLAETERPHQELALAMEKANLPEPAAKAREYARQAAEVQAKTAEQIQHERALVAENLATAVNAVLVNGKEYTQVYQATPGLRDHSDLIYELSGVDRPTNWDEAAQDHSGYKIDTVESPLGYSIREYRPSEALKLERDDARTIIAEPSQRYAAGASPAIIDL